MSRENSQEFNVFKIEEYKKFYEEFIKSARDGGFLKEGRDGLSLYRAASIGSMQECYKIGVADKQAALDGCVASYIFSDNGSREFMKDELKDCEKVMYEIEKTAKQVEKAEGKTTTLDTIRDNNVKVGQGVNNQELPVNSIVEKNGGVVPRR
jgi:hypothetical protein